MRTLSAFSANWLLSFLFIGIIAFGGPLSAGQANANPKYAGIVVDAKTGRTLYAYRADNKRYPASLTKMMTIYMMFDALESGKLTKKSRIRMSKYAASKPPSKLGIPAGRSIRADHAILALATKSANDVAAAVAEHLGGTEPGFAKMMTAKARELGMKNTTFKNASGLTAKGQLTTARDMARLGLALREHFPQHYHYFSTRNFKYGKANYRNHNRLLGNVKGVDGIKTGYTRASGFNLVSSVEANRRSIVAVVIGGRSGKSRNAQMRKLISQYLKKASRGQKEQIIASRKSAKSVQLASASSVKLPKIGPVPVFRPRTVDTSEPVSVASMTPVPNQAPSRIATLAERMAPGPAPLRPSAEVAFVDPVQTATPSPIPMQQTVAEKPSGWVIQIAAADSRDKAISLLQNARQRMPGLLGSKELYTEPVQANGTTLHRARFVGFSGKNDARKACKVLKTKKINCLALSG